MKRVTITYLMLGHDDEFEADVTLTMQDRIAEELLQNERWSSQLARGGLVRPILENMSRLRGHEYMTTLEVTDAGPV